MQTNVSNTTPDFPLPAGYTSHDNYLEQLVRAGAQSLYTVMTKPVNDRIQQELAIIQRLGFAQYYLILQDILQAARKMNILVGPGRGNAAGSIIAYCLGITAVDPLAYGLLFERVLHPDGNTIPDIDSDVDLEGRPAIVDYTNRKYNGRVLITQYDEVHPAETGVLQVDILGKKTFSILKTASTLIRQNHEKDFTLNKISLADAATYRLFQEGNTSGIPFFDHPDMQAYLKELKPVSYTQLVAIYALFNSGTFQFVSTYIQNKNQAPDFAYDLPALKEILGETCGVLIYQEQLMVLSQRIAGFSPEDSDRLRRALQKKKNIALRPGFRSKFLQGGKDNGHIKATLENTWEEWEIKGEYLFNKSHAVSFVLVAYQTAWIKCHYPTEFLSAVRAVTAANA